LLRIDGSQRKYLDPEEAQEQFRGPAQQRPPRTASRDVAREILHKPINEAAFFPHVRDSLLKPGTLPSRTSRELQNETMDTVKLIDNVK
jgi:hypothetical protein